MAVSRNHPLMTMEKANLWRKKLLVNTAAKQGQNCDIKFALVHVIDQIDKNFFRAAVA